jgi:pimeloyl-ACP methyl ester carboxylesterase
VSLNYVREGSGPPLLLIHGLGGALATWEPVIGLLAPHRDVIAIDMPGFGRSERLADGTRHSAVEMGREIAGFCAEIGLDQPHLAGNSLGAWVALEMAADGAAASVCGISPAGLWRGPLGPRNFDSHRIGKRLAPLVLAAVRTERGRRALLGTTVARPGNLTSEQAMQWVGDWLASPGYDDANERMRALVFERQEEVTVPVTIAWGARDRLVSAPRPERMPKHTVYREMPEWGHTPTADDPEGVAALLLEASSETAGEAAGEAAAAN